MRSTDNLKKSSSWFWSLLSKADLSKPWGRFFQILCVSQKVRTLTAIMIKTFCVFLNFMNLNKSFLRISIDDFMKWKWLKLLSTHNSKIQTYEQVKVCIQFFDMWCYCLSRNSVKNCSNKLTLHTEQTIFLYWYTFNNKAL